MLGAYQGPWGKPRPPSPQSVAGESCRASASACLTRVPSLVRVGSLWMPVRILSNTILCKGEHPVTSTEMLWWLPPPRTCSGGSGRFPSLLLWRLSPVLLWRCGGSHPYLLSSTRLPQGRTPHKGRVQSFHHRTQGQVQGSHQGFPTQGLRVPPVEGSVSGFPLAMLLFSNTGKQSTSSLLTSLHAKTKFNWGWHSLGHDFIAST